MQACPLELTQTPLALLVAAQTDPQTSGGTSSRRPRITGSWGDLKANGATRRGGRGGIPGFTSNVMLNITVRSEQRLSRRFRRRPQLWFTATVGKGTSGLKLRPKQRAALLSVCRGQQTGPHDVTRRSAVAELNGREMAQTSKAVGELSFFEKPLRASCNCRSADSAAYRSVSCRPTERHTTRTAHDPTMAALRAAICRLPSPLVSAAI